ncbi:MAG: ATP synthase subunit alpha [Candidatus Dojkabacteria bacterium]|nr:MAG: ATP synthase subunit alpha [Candidatus Dojkabacteria bacterium]
MVESIKNKINQIDFSKPGIYSEGEVISYGDGIATINGLKNVAMGEVVHIYEYGSHGKYAPALAFNLSYDTVGVILLDETLNIQTGCIAKTTGETLNIEVSDAFLGRVIDIFGRPIDGKGNIFHPNPKKQPVERKAYGVIDRESVNVPLQTGIIAIDALIPIGRGQRELIIGDRQTGKTALALDIIINQGRINQRIENGEIEGKPVYSIYVAIGQKQSKVAQIIRKLEELNVLKYTIVLSASSSDSASVQYLAPYVGTAIGEYFMEIGDDALIVYDDLSKHARAYRQISLLLHRPPGREAYPGDIFYLHSRLLERSARLNKSLGGGSLTSLPIIETLAGDISAYIPTNVISITDGQIYLKSELFNSGIKPAIDIGNSVSRVGGSAQIKAMKQVAGPLKLNLAQFRELQTFVQFGVEVDPTTQKKIDLGLRLVEILKQDQYSSMPVEEEVVLLWAVTQGYANDIDLEKVQPWSKSLLQFFRDYYADTLLHINKEKVLSSEIEIKLRQAIDEFKTKGE